MPELNLNELDREMLCSDLEFFDTDCQEPEEEDYYDC